MSGRSSFTVMPVTTGYAIRLYEDSGIPGRLRRHLLPELSASTEARFPDLCVRSFTEPAPALRQVAATVRRAYPATRPAKAGQRQKRSRG